MGRWVGGDYVYHESGEDVLNILICQIRVWDAKQDDASQDKGVIFTEVEDIEITESYKELISTATIKIPRGSVIAKTLVSDNKDNVVKTGNLTNDTNEKSQKKTTETGQVLVPGDSVDSSGNSTLSGNFTRDDWGFVDPKKSVERLVNKDDFAIGNRIEIKLGYYKNSGNEPDDPDNDIFDRIKTETVSELVTCFRGFITGCSPTTPLEVTCEGMGCKLKKKACPNFNAKKDYTINDLFAAGGELDLLKGTGLVLSDATKSMNINIGKINMTSSQTVADLCEELSRCGLTCFIEPDGKTFRVARLMFSGGKQEGNKEYVRFSDNSSITLIQFDWDVANDGMSITRIDKNFLAVKAQAWVKKDDGLFHTMRVTVRKADKDTEGAMGGFIFTNEHNPEPKKNRKRKNGENKKKQMVMDLTNYTTVPYISPNRNITMDQLKEEAKTYFKKFSDTGVSGSVTIFGDKMIHPSETVLLIDPRQPEKNGMYLVETVTTTFGVDGYRRELKLPNKISNYSQPIKYID